MLGDTTTKGKSMPKVWRAVFGRRTHDERGSEFAAAIIVFPILFMLIIGCVEIGYYVQTRMRVENIARDAARQVAADGGNYNIRTNTSGKKIDQRAAGKLMKGGKCALSSCDAPGAKIDCSIVTTVAGFKSRGKDVVQHAGETVTCEVFYPYKPLSGTLLDGVMGLGIGGILKDFPVSESARSETGTLG